MTSLLIFWVFFKLGFIALGGVFGVLPELERDVVTQYGWMSSESFIQAYVMGQFVPGPNMAMCPLIGYQVAGWTGWFAAFLGIYSAPLIMMALTYAIYSRTRELEWVRRTEISLRPLVIGLLTGAAIHLWWIQSEQARIFALLLTALGIGAYQQKWLGPLRLTFSLGAIWWLYLSSFSYFRGATP